MKQGDASQDWKSVVVVKQKRRRLGAAGEAWWDKSKDVRTRPEIMADEFQLGEFVREALQTKFRYVK